MRYVTLQKFLLVTDVLVSNLIQSTITQASVNTMRLTIHIQLYNGDELVSNLKKQIQDLNAIRATVTIIADPHFQFVKHTMSN